MSRVARLVGASALTGYTALQVLGRRAGSTAQERAASLPGDELVLDPQMVTNHVGTTAATPEHIWPWLTQAGWPPAATTRPGGSTDLLFRENWPSLDYLDPNLLHPLLVGDTIPDGKPGTAQYVVHRVEPPDLLLLNSTTHIPPGWDDRYGARFTWTWCFRLTPVADARTRVHLWVRGRSDPWWFTALYVGAIVPADYIMATGMLRGLKERAEGNAPVYPSGRQPFELAATT